MTTDGLNLRSVSLEGGVPQQILISGDFITGANWAADGNVYFARNTRGVWRVSENGGDPTQVLSVDGGEIASRPSLLPGGEWVIYGVRTDREAWNDARIIVYNQATREKRVLPLTGGAPKYVPTGHLLFIRDQDLYAAPFDADRIEVGDAQRVVEGVEFGPGAGAAGQYAVSDNGTLAYKSPRPPTLRQTYWVDRDGSRREAWGEPVDLAHATMLSPGGDRALVASTNTALIVLQPDQDHLLLPTGPLPVSRNAVWAPAGNEIVYEAINGLMYRIGRRRQYAAGTCGAERGSFPSARLDAERRPDLRRPRNVSASSVAVVDLDGWDRRPGRSPGARGRRRRDGGGGVSRWPLPGLHQPPHPDEPQRDLHHGTARRRTPTGLERGRPGAGVVAGRR